MSYRFILFAAIAAAVSLPMKARVLSPADALLRAESEMTDVAVKSYNAKDLHVDMTHIYTVTAGEQPGIYLFSGSAGLLAVSARSESGRAVIGYSVQEGRDVAALPPQMMWWLEMCADSMPQESDAEASREPISPLSATLWSQESPYNMYTPLLGDKRAPTGCVATAMAQAMAIVKWPEHGTGTNSYTSYGNDGAETELSFDFGSTEFKWDDMLPVYSDSTSDAAQDSQVATLMYACGVSVNMQYNLDGSGSNYMEAAEALVKYFGYDKGLQYYERIYFDDAEWEDMIYAELKAGRPVLYSGTDADAGHAFLCDGYDRDGYFHFNWGWGGAGNGYFLLSALNPLVSGTGGNGSGYNMNQSILIGLKRAEADSEVVPQLWFSGDFGVGSMSYGRADDTHVVFTAENGLFSHTPGTNLFLPGLKLTDSSGKVTYVSGSIELRLSMNEAATDYYILAENFPKEGSYTVTPTFQYGADGTWHDALVARDCRHELTLTASPDELRFGDVSDLSLPSVAPADMAIVADGDNLMIKASKDISAVQVYAIDGRSIPVSAAIDGCGAVMSTAGITPGVYLIDVQLTSGARCTARATVH